MLVAATILFVVSALSKTAVLIAMTGGPHDDSKDLWLRSITVPRHINLFSFVFGALAFINQEHEIAIALFLVSVIAAVAIVHMSSKGRRAS